MVLPCRLKNRMANQVESLTLFSINLEISEIFATKPKAIDSDIATVTIVGLSCVSIILKPSVLTYHLSVNPGIYKKKIISK